MVNNCYCRKCNVWCIDENPSKCHWCGSEYEAVIKSERPYFIPQAIMREIVKKGKGDVICGNKD